MQGEKKLFVSGVLCGHAKSTPATHLFITQKIKFTLNTELESTFCFAGFAPLPGIMQPSSEPGKLVPSSYTDMD